MPRNTPDAAPVRTDPVKEERAGTREAAASPQAPAAAMRISSIRFPVRRSGIRRLRAKKRTKTSTNQADM